MSDARDVIAQECLAYGVCPAITPMSGVMRCADCPRTKVNKLKVNWSSDRPLDEKISRAIAIENGEDPDELAGYAALHPIWTQYHGSVLLTLSALNSAGLKVLGREPTEAMIGGGDIGCKLADLWREMFDAAPPSGE